jgi:hypothetical protein
VSGGGFAAFPTAAAWRHRADRTGVEVAFFSAIDQGWRIEGSCAAVEAGAAWICRYRIEIDADFRTRRAEVVGQFVTGTLRRTLEAADQGEWLVDGVPAPALSGCLDVDLAASAMTNTFPIHRLDLELGVERDAPAAYVQVDGLAVSRLPQTYRRIHDGPEGPRYDYTSPTHDFRAVLDFDRSGLILDYPQIATRLPL